MAGSHKVAVRRSDRNNWFELSARPANLLSRIPILGPFFAFNVGRNPKFAVTARYLGYKSDEPHASDYDASTLPNPDERDLWDFDLYLIVDDDSVEGGDDIALDLKLTTVERKKQTYITRRWPLTDAGRAKLQIGVPNVYEDSLYSFEVKDITSTVAMVLFGVSTAAISFLLGLWSR